MLGCLFSAVVRLHIDPKCTLQVKTCLLFCCWNHNKTWYFSLWNTSKSKITINPLVTQISMTFLRDFRECFRITRKSRRTLFFCSTSICMFKYIIIHNSVFSVSKGLKYKENRDRETERGRDRERERARWIKCSRDK